MDKLTPDTELWPTHVVLSLTTMRLLCDFADLHALAERVNGGPIWTHEFAHKPTVERLREAVFAEHPALRSFKCAVDNPGDVPAALAVIRAMFGETLPIRAPATSLRTAHPLAVLEEVAPGKPVIVVEKE